MPPNTDVEVRHGSGIKPGKRAASRPKQIPAERDDGGQKKFDNKAHRRRPRSEAEPLIERIEWQLEPDEELPELGVLCTHLVETHLIDDCFDVRGRPCKEGHEPLLVVEAGRAGDELENAARIGAADAGVAGHEFFAGIEIKRIPILAWRAAFGHRVKADDRPVGEVRLKAILQIFRHAGPEGLHLLVEGRRARSEFVLGLERGGVFRITGGVFAALGHREPAKGRCENVRPEGGRKTLGEGVGILQVRRKQHEAEVGLWRDHAEEEELRAGGRTDFADEFGKGGLGYDARGFVEDFPSGILHAEEKVEDMAALGG